MLTVGTTTTTTTTANKNNNVQIYTCTVPTRPVLDLSNTGISSSNPAVYIGVTFICILCIFCYLVLVQILRWGDPSLKEFYENSIRFIIL